MAFETVKKNLEKRGYAVRVFDSRREAVEYLRGQISGTTVGIGGSVTVDEMGLYDELVKNNTVYWHWRLKEGQTADEARRLASSAEVYISSVNGLAETGEIVNIDGSGNRVASTIFGHKKVYFVVGRNKIAENLDKAMDRAQNVAAPLNARRLKLSLPCAVKGDKCYQCESPAKICRVVCVFQEKPLAEEAEVILINEDLGY